MEISDLRIGNLIKDNRNNKIVEICRINGVNEEITYGKFPFNDSHLWCAGKHCFDPILLTEEKLLKFGFTKLGRFERNGGLDSETIYKIEAKIGLLSYVCLYEKPGESYWYLKYGMTDIYVKDRLKYVHRLQNLYFALVGEELKVI